MSGGRVLDPDMAGQDAVSAYGAFFMFFDKHDVFNAEIEKRKNLGPDTVNDIGKVDLLIGQKI